MVYKVLVDLDKIDLNKLATVARGEKVDFCIAEDCLFFHTMPHSSTQISDIMKKTKTTAFIVKIIKERPNNPEESFGDAWCFEKINEDELFLFNEQHQTELQKMAETIEEIRDALEQDKLIQKEGLGNGNSQEKKARKTKKNSAVGKS